MSPVVVSNAGRIVFPEVGLTKGDVVDYFARIAPRLLPHVARRPLSVKRYPKGLAGPGFFQKNVAAHYPASIERFAVPRSPDATRRHPRGRGGEEPADATVYPIASEADHLAFFANQGALELHVPTARVPDLLAPDRIVFDLNPPAGAPPEQVRSAARLVRRTLAELGLPTVPVATGSKGYHLVAPVTPRPATEASYATLQKAAELVAHAHPEELTTAFRIVQRKKRVFVDWLRNFPLATVVAPYSLRARPRATVAVPLAWDELDARAPDAFTLADLELLLERPDPLVAAEPVDAAPFAGAVDEAYARAGLVFTPFDRFRS